ncbi:aspartyl-tRNA(Asn)/glutamyl-tRNA(Gln) amidotransferase subunit A [Ancylobacter sp. 3268]|uniref:amidase n=1 Tax=Ancylobacter sp. 3268 TaxID=2817752 RepID=UPI002855F45D|nr:amidase [Ancylobacter sp. 3268]MDR6954804.1 aspartyl-tRNA(Asn)/glutamyl-tRNA(Gln) amidotransferase subunit A [Ancylobacter sp. 3268]
MVDPLAFLSVRALAEGYRAGRFTPNDVCRCAMDQLRGWEPRLNAFIDPMTDEMMRQADEATRQLARGEDKGPLHGIPVAIKDIIDVAGFATSYATKALTPRLAARDADCVRRLRRAGAILFGKTNLLEFAYGIAHPAFGQTNNPCDPSRTAGGSSGGSAAAVAAGIVPLALGTDTGGSVRAPAAYCGVVGLKPSYGLLSLDGVYPLSPSLDHLGILGRNVQDVALAVAALAPALSESTEPARPCLGMARHQWEHPAMQPEVRISMEAAARRLREAGVEIIEIDLPAPEAMATALLDILLPEAALVHAETFRQAEAGYAPGTAAQIRAGMSLPALRYLAAKAQQERWTAELNGIFAAVDAVIAPTVPFVAPDTDPALSAEGDDEILTLTHANLTGAPSVSVPCRREGGLPVGLQFTGPRGGDAALLSLVRRLEPLL